jgi:hypothetical protein
MAATWSSDHSAIYHGLQLCLDIANDLSLAIGSSRIDRKVTLMQLGHQLNSEARICPFPSFVPQIWQLSVPGPNTFLQPQEQLRLVRNAGSFLRPCFRGRGGASSNLSYTTANRYTFGTEHREAMTQGGNVNNIQISHLLCARHVWLGTRNTRLNSVHEHFPLSDSPHMFEFFPYPSTQPRSNPRSGYVCFHHLSHKCGTFLIRALTQSCSLGNHYVWDVM